MFFYSQFSPACSGKGKWKLEILIIYLGVCYVPFLGGEGWLFVHHELRGHLSMSHAVKQILTELSAGVIEDTKILMERYHLGKL